jgi:cell division protein FtsQ
MRGSIRVLAWCLAIVLVALPLVGVLRGWFAAQSWPVTRLVVQAHFKYVDAAQIRAAVAPRVDKGFFALDLGAVQRAVAALPWVEAVEVRKRWPDTLVLRVHERQPFAHWNEQQLISNKGVVFDASLPAGAPALPELRGPDARLAEVVSFYSEARKAFAGAQVRVQGLSLTDRGSWSIRIGDGARVVVGDSAQAASRLHRFLDVLPQLMTGHDRAFVYADLRYTNGFAVLWPAATPTTAGGTPPA